MSGEKKSPSTGDTGVGPSSGRTHRDTMTSVIAGVIILLWAAGMLRVLLSPTLDQTTLQLGQTVMSIFGPILGVVLGYYFGERTAQGAVQQAERRVLDAIEEKDRVKTVSTEELDRLERDYTGVKERLRQLEALFSKEAASQEAAVERRSLDAPP